MPHLFIVEDEQNLASILADYFRREHFTVDLFFDGLSAQQALQKSPPDLLLLDLMLPGVDGLTVLRELRQTSQLPVILVTAKVEEIDRLIGLELGADDYVCKPYSPREVVARVKAVLRRFQVALPTTPLPQNAQPAPAGIHQLSPSAALTSPPPLPLSIDQERRRVRWQDRPLDLTPREFDLLVTLAGQPGRVFSRSQLLDQICPNEFDISERAIDSHMKNLRKKLDQLMPDTPLIRSIYGVGFVFELPL